MVSIIRQCYIAPMDRLEIIAIIAGDLCCESPSQDAINRLLQFQRDRYRCALMRAIRWLCAKQVHEPEFRELWAMIALAEASEIAQQHFPSRPPVAAQALAFAWERGGDRVEMRPSSRQRILNVVHQASSKESL